VAIENLRTGGLAGVNPIKPGEAGAKPQGPGSAAGSEFRKALDQFAGVPGAPGAGIGAGIGAGAGVGVGQAAPLKGVAPELGATAAQKLKFSQHSVERMTSRGISFPAEEMARIESAVQKAAAKGSKDALILSGDKALIVSVKNNTVVTVMDRAAMKDNVFTNIDSTVVL
jgi:flagellar operon protein